MVLQISEGTTLWSHALEFIFSKITEVFDALKKADENIGLSEQGTAEASYRVWQQQYEEAERSYFLFLLTKTLLDTTDRHLSLLRDRDNKVSATMSHGCEATEQSKNTQSIAELWRSHYNVQINSHNIVSSYEDKYERTKSDVRRWVQILHDSLSSVSLNFSLLSVLINECVPLSLSFKEEAQ